MSFFGRITLLLVISVALAAASGCSPGDASQMDEEKEPHFVLGNSRCDERDWPGAIEAFEESLEVNPHSAEAHYRLAEIFDTEQPDPAAAIYHYQEYLKLEPDAENRDVINQRIHSCKMQLAADVCGLPDAPAFQKQMDSLVQQNQQLQGQVDKLTGELQQWSAYYVSLKASGAIGPSGSPAVYNNPASAPAPQPAGVSPTPDDITTAASQPVSSTPNSSPQPQPQAAAQTWHAPEASRPRLHTHVVAYGETMAAIARKHGLSIYALEDANPGVNPKKLRVGQTLNVP